MTPRRVERAGDEGPPNGESYLWFWAFWHWSVENFRGGALLRGPVLGIGSHWDEWYRSEADGEDRRAIDAAGRDAEAQRGFLTWLATRWGREATWRGRRIPVPFVLGQLAQLPPFDAWSTLDARRQTYGAPGVSAIVLGEGSAGEATDVCAVEAVAIDVAGEAGDPRIVPEGFRADAADLETVRQAAHGLFERRGLGVLLTLWLACGRRPYPRPLAVALRVGWLAVVGLVVMLRFGPDPGASLFALGATLLALWAALAATALAVAAVVLVGAARTGRAWGARLERSEIRLRMGCGLTVQGASAGLAFCLDTMLAVYRAAPSVARRSWLWRRVFAALHGDMSAWVATGVVTADAHVRPVTLLPKVRASLRRHGVRHILAPRQSDASARAVARVRAAEPVAFGGDVAPRLRASGARAALGFAAELPRLRSHPVRHVAQALLVVGGLASGWQGVANGCALVTSAVVIAALPDLRTLLDAAPPPGVTGPASQSPYYLWVSLDTRRPTDFVVELESDFWANRRAPVHRIAGVVGSTRGELRLQRLHRASAADVEDGIVWVARRRRFLGRELMPGERVGRYTFSYVASRK
jgi:hypothetical protein